MKRLCLYLLLWLWAGGALAAELRPVAVEVWWLPGEFVPGQQPDGNSVMLRGSKGWIVFDTGRHPEHTLTLLDFARASRLPIAGVVNSHWHLDHIGGNARFRGAVPGLRIYASAAIDSALGGWLARYRAQLLAIIADPKTREADRANYRSEVALIDAGRALTPSIQIRDTRNWRIAGRDLRLGLVSRAVTEGDVWLYDRKSRTLAAGDLVTFPVPFFDTACPSGWQQALHGLESVAFKRVVPGHGPILSRLQFQQYVGAFDGLLECAASTRSSAECAADWNAALGDLLPASERARTGAMIDYYFTQLLRTPEAQQHCSPADRE